MLPICDELAEPATPALFKRTHYPLEAMMDLQVREAHLYFLTLMARLFKLKGAL